MLTLLALLVSLVAIGYRIKTTEDQQAHDYQVGVEYLLHGIDISLHTR